MRRSKITIVLVTGLLLATQVSAYAQGDRPSSGGASPTPATEAADAPAKAATPSSETSLMKGTSANPAAGEPSVSLATLAAGPLAVGHVPACRYHREGGHDRPCGGFARNLDGLGRKEHRAFWCARCGSARAAHTRKRRQRSLRPMKSCAAAQVRWRNSCKPRQTRSGSPPICAPTA